MTEESLHRNGELLICGRCNRPYEPGDRFCRKCGATLNNLPVAREDCSPEVWRSPVPAIARGVAVVAVGTLAEFALKRAIRLVFRPRSLLPMLRHSPTSIARRNTDDGFEPDAIIESETFAVRRVKVRRARDS